MGYNTNDVTGAPLVTKAATKQYQEGWDRIFGSKNKKDEEPVLRRHDFWGAGEPDCPKDLKASNGELRTMRCKVCGDGWRKSIDVCFGERQDS
jgi:hypothetical protein